MIESFVNVGVSICKNIGNDSLADKEVTSSIMKPLFNHIFAMSMETGIV